MKSKQPRRHCVACGRQLYPGHRCPETFERKRKLEERMAELGLSEPEERTFSDRLDEAEEMRRASGDFE